MAERYIPKYSVDLVLVIDITGDMRDYYDKIRDGAERVYGASLCAVEARGFDFESFRIKLIAFRDFEADGAENALIETEFFTMPEDSGRLKRALDGLRPEGGGDDPEDGLEALARAIKSDWCSSGGIKKRHIISVFSNAPCHELGEGRKMDMPDYPADMPRSIDELSAMWGDRRNPGIMDERFKRLILYTPDCTPGYEYGSLWSYISESWNNRVYLDDWGESGPDMESWLGSVADLILNW